MILKTKQSDEKYCDLKELSKYYLEQVGTYVCECI